jgi:hypothetical protein
MYLVGVQEWEAKDISRRIPLLHHLPAIATVVISMSGGGEEAAKQRLMTRTLKIVNNEWEVY